MSLSHTPLSLQLGVSTCILSSTYRITGDPYYDENGEKRDPHMEKKDPYEKHEDPYAEKQPYEGEEKEMVEDVHAHSEFTVRPLRQESVVHGGKSNVLLLL